MYVPVSHRSSQQADELRAAATATLDLLRRTLAMVIASEESAEYGLNIGDAASLATVNEALERFLERDRDAGLATLDRRLGDAAKRAGVELLIAMQR